MCTDSSVLLPMKAVYAVSCMPIHSRHMLQQMLLPTAARTVMQAAFIWNSKQAAEATASSTPSAPLAACQAIASIAPFQAVVQCPQQGSGREFSEHAGQKQ